MRLELWCCDSARADASCGGDEEGEGEGGRGAEVAAARLSLADICGGALVPLSGAAGEAAGEAATAAATAPVRHSLDTS